MPINLSKEKVSIGNIIYKWKIKEYEQYDRDRRWYLFTGIAGILLIAFGIWTANYLFILVVVLFGIVLMLHGHQEPIVLDFALAEKGIVVGSRFYRYSELNGFWIIYNPPEVKSLYFGFDKFWKHRLIVPLYDYDPEAVRNVLAQFIEEDFEKEDEPLSDRMARIFRLY